MFPTKITSEVPSLFKDKILKDITKEQMETLNRLTMWLAKGETSIEDQFNSYRAMIDRSGEGFVPEELTSHPLEKALDNSVPF